MQPIDVMQPIDPATLPSSAQQLVGDNAPAKLQAMAARGIVPGLKPDALLAVLVLLAESRAADIRRTAAQTLRELPEPLLRGALQADLHAAVILQLCQSYANDIPVLEKLLQMRQLPIEGVEHLARHGGRATTELVATNQERLLAHPDLIGLLYLNKATRMSTADRLVDFAVRSNLEINGIPAWREVSQAIRDELIPVATAEPLPEDNFFFDTDSVAESLSDDLAQDAYFEDGDGQEQLQARLKPLFQRLAEMSMSQKIRRAMVGTKEERMMLIRESNKVIASAAARSPLLQEAEVTHVARNRGVCEDVLRIIGTNPEWMKSYQIKHALVANAKTPIAISQRLVVHLREADLRRLVNNKNVASAVRLAAKRHLSRRKH